jgi:hypothetical protein
MRPRPNDVERIAEEAWLIVGGNPTKDSKFTRPQIDLLVKKAISKIFQTRIFDNYKIEGNWDVPGEFMVTFTGVVINYDEARFQSYIVTPTQFINLPHSKGVYTIAPMPTKAEKNPFRGAFIPVQANSYVFTETRESPFLQGNIGYLIEGPRIYFIDQGRIQEDNIGPLLVRLVTGDAPADMLMIPADMEGDIIDWVLQRLKETGDTDQAEDNVDQG